MHTQAGTNWRGIPTRLDALSWPPISFGGGGMSQTYFLLSGHPAFVLVFDAVEAVCAYEETPYWSLAEEQKRPQHVLNLILDTPLLRRLREFRQAPWLWHFLVCGGDMCAEVIAGSYAIIEYATAKDAEDALSGVIRGQGHASFGNMEWLSPDNKVR